MLLSAGDPSMAKASVSTLTLPVPLAEAIKSKRAIVFLGAGASKGI